MNVERIRALAEHIESLPTVGMTWDDAQRQAYCQRTYAHLCGTPACIAGWAVHLFGDAEGNGEPGEAGALLGLEPDAAAMLFHGDPFNARGRAWGHEAGDGATDREATAADAAATLRHLADTGRVDWRRGS